MADQQKQDQNENQQLQQQQGRQNQQRADPNGEVSRSEDLLPAGAADNADGRFEVAEEVSLDQQSDATRRVGQAPKGIASDALADSLKSDKSGKPDTSSTS